MSKLSREGNYINEATFISTWNQMNKAHHTNNRGIKSALHIFRFRICGFDQLSIENIKKKKNPESFKKQNLILSHTGNYWCRVYIILVIISNLEMI